MSANAERVNAADVNAANANAASANAANVNAANANVVSGASSASRPMEYVEMEASPALSDVVMSYWGFVMHALPSPDFVHRVWPDGCASLVLGLLGGGHSLAVVVGASTVAGAVPMKPGDQYWGIRFRPEAGAVSLSREADALRDGRFPASEVFGDAVQPLLQQLQTLSDADDVARVLDAWMLQHRVDANAIDSLARNAVQHIVRTDGTCSMLELANTLGVTSRQLQRRFRASTGLTPKEYANIRRARAALKRVLSGESKRALGGWARVAAESGFADQAHLARECARLLTLAPTAVSSRLDEIAHSRLVD